MKSIIITMTIFMLISPSLCSAEILDKFKEMRYRIEAGVSYRSYSDLYQQLYVDYKMSKTDKHSDLMTLYTDVRDLWHFFINDDSEFLRRMSPIMSKYPDIQYHLKNCKLDYSRLMTCALQGTVKAAEKMEAK